MVGKTCGKGKFCCLYLKLIGPCCAVTAGVVIGRWKTLLWPSWPFTLQRPKCTGNKWTVVEHLAAKQRPNTTSAFSRVNFNCYNLQHAWCSGVICTWSRPGGSTHRRTYRPTYVVRARKHYSPLVGRAGRMKNNVKNVIFRPSVWLMLRVWLSLAKTGLK